MTQNVVNHRKGIRAETAAIEDGVHARRELVIGRFSRRQRRARAYQQEHRGAGGGSAVREDQEAHASRPAGGVN